MTGFTQAADYQPGYLDAEDPDMIDVGDSLGYEDSEQKRVSFGGDLRGGYFNTEVDARDGGNDQSDNVAARFRYGANLGFTDHLRLKVRLAATCSDSNCDPDINISSRPSG